MTDGLKDIVLVRAKLQGTTPLLLHSSNGMNPRNQILQTIKPIQGRRGKQKTELVVKSLEKADWLVSGIWETEGRCWLDGEDFLFSGYRQPVLPAEYLIRTIQSAATAVKLGKAVKQALSADTAFFPFRYDGPVDAEEMFEDPRGRFVDYRSVRVQQSRIMRSRVRIPEAWYADATFYVDTKVLDLSTVYNILVDAGRREGTGDFRPKFGKFVPLLWEILGTLNDFFGNAA